MNSLNNSIFENRELLIKIWIDLRRSRDFSAGLMWESVKYFSTLISALITFDIFFLRFFLEDTEMPSQQYMAGIVFLSLSLILPIFIIVVSIVGERELKRRWMRFLETIAYASKIESLLGLDQKLASASRIFPKDEYLFQRWVKSGMKYQSSEEFIKGELKGYNMYTHMRKIYIITGLIGGILIIIPVFFHG